MASAMQVIGLHEVLADLTFASATIQARSSGIVEMFAHRVEDTMKVFVPVDEGETLQSIHTTMVDDQTADVGPTTKQGFFMENGTYKDPPQAYAGPALDRHSGDFVTMLGLQAGMV